MFLYNKLIKIFKTFIIYEIRQILFQIFFPSKLCHCIILYYFTVYKNKIKMSFDKNSINILSWSYICTIKCYNKIMKSNVNSHLFYLYVYIAIIDGEHKYYTYLVS